MRLANTIVAGNADALGAPDLSATGLLGSECGNLIGDGTGSGLAPDCDQVGSPGQETDPRLSDLGDHGGITETHDLTAGSPAIDFAVTVVGGCADPDRPVVVDQRAIPRPQGDHCDVGSVEFVPEPSPEALLLAALIATALVSRRGSRCRPHPLRG